jgi:hypothetical protein
MWMIALLAVFGCRLTYAQSSSNDVLGTVRDVDACVQRLQEIRDEVVKLEEAAPPNQVELVDCIHSRVLKIKGLVELALGAQHSIYRAVKTDEPETVDSYATNAKLCCTIAEKLLLETRGCATSVTVKSATTNEALAAVTNSSVDIKITPRAAGLPPIRRTVVRTRETCIHQEQFATLLGRAMDLKMTDKTAPEDYMKALARLAVEPLHGWQSGKCVTVDDVYVACSARVSHQRLRRAAAEFAARRAGLGE